MTPAARKPAAAPADVDAFLAALAHPQKPAIVALREIILAADPSTFEGIKWNAPSFHPSPGAASSARGTRQDPASGFEATA